MKRLSALSCYTARQSSAQQRGVKMHKTTWHNYPPENMLNKILKSQKSQTKVKGPKYGGLFTYHEIGRQKFEEKEHLPLFFTRITYSV